MFFLCQFQFARVDDLQRHFLKYTVRVRAREIGYEQPRELRSASTANVGQAQGDSESQTWRAASELSWRRRRHSRRIVCALLCGRAPAAQNRACGVVRAGECVPRQSQPDFVTSSRVNQRRRRSNWLTIFLSDEYF